MFTTLVVQPIFNLLVLIYAVIPGHNFGVAIILFTILVRLLMWPLVKKQLHHAKAMRKLQPELKKIKQAAGGDRQKESKLVMELYKEREINPFSSLGIVLLQLPIFLGLYLGLKRIIDKPDQIIDFSYSWLHHLGWLQTLAADIHRFDDSLLGVINLTKIAIGPGGVYWPALILVTASALAQYFQSRMLLPKTDDARSLRNILKDAGKGKSADQQEVGAAVGRSTIYIIPFFVFIVSIHLAAALSLYWLTSSLVAYIQQSRVLKEDETEAVALAEEVVTTVAEDKPAKRPKPKARRKKRKH